jgi:elongator complex protein 6
LGFGYWEQLAETFVMQGLDLDKLTVKKRFQFVDGLSGLFLPKQLRAAPGRVGEKILSDPSLASVSGEVQNGIQALRNSEGTGRIILVVDQLDLLLAAGGDQIGPVSLGDMLMSLRQVCDPWGVV